ncbi:MAG TPA: hypothetical protein VHE79_07690, partial [Spirochaetia bacterium]
HPRWVNGTNVFRYTRFHHTPDAAITGWWMLAVDEHLEPSAPFAARAAALGDFLLGAQRPSGAIPTWVDAARDARATGPLAECASSAAAGMFLARLAARGGREAHRAAARRVAEFLIARVFPGNEWYDTEVFFSCSRKPPGWRDPVTGIPPQGTLSMSWAAGMLLELFAQTGEDRYLRYGRAVLDRLLLFQQVWDAPFLSYDTRGGFGVMNTDAEWSDARQASFAPLLMGWYDVTGEPELFQRGVAALRASFTLMHTDGVDHGALPENYGHAGRDRHIQGYIMPDWGAGTACSTAALVRSRWGDLFVDARRGRAFGIDGCRVTGAVFGPTSIALTVERLGDAPLLVRIGGAEESEREIVVNGARIGRLDKDAIGKGVLA